jgi:hypothetical protein
LVLIYESVTSSVSVVRWLTLHSSTLNSQTNESSFMTDDCSMNDDCLRLTCEVITCPFITRANRRQNTNLNNSTVILCVFVASESAYRAVVWQWTIPSSRFSDTLVVTGTCLAKRCLAMYYSGFQASCHNIYMHVYMYVYM